jgi:hypothetical protein
MRRALLAVLAGGTLLAGAACDSDANTTAGVAVPSAPAPSSAPPSSVAPPDFSANTRLVCGRLQGIYQTELRDLGAAMGKMITYKEAKQAAEAQKAENTAADQLKATAAKIRKETGAARDPEFKAAGVVSARKLELSAKDRRYFDRVKTLNDLNRTIEGQLTEWLTPVAGYCGAA